MEGDREIIKAPQCEVADGIVSPLYAGLDRLPFATGRLRRHIFLGRKGRIDGRSGTSSQRCLDSPHSLQSFHRRFGNASVYEFNEDSRRGFVQGRD